MITLLGHDMAGSCKELIDSCIEQIHMQTNPLDCMQIHDENFTKISILHICLSKMNHGTSYIKSTMEPVYYMYSKQAAIHTHSTIDHFCC